MQQVAVRRVDFECVDAEPVGAPRRRDERLAHALKAARVERARRQLALLVRHGRWTLRLPAALGKRNLLAAVPRHMAGALAAGMSKLHSHRGFGMLAHLVKDRLLLPPAVVYLNPDPTLYYPAS